MGHIRLSRLPNSRRWRTVVDLLDARGNAAEVLAAGAYAAEKDLQQAANDPVLGAAVRLLAMIPQAARQGDFAGALRQLGLAVPDRPLLFDVSSAAGLALDQRMDRPGARTDFGEIARSALVDSINAQIGLQLPGLFGASADDVREAAASLGRARFSDFARDFFSRLTRGSMAYFLSRELSRHIGSDAAFSSLDERRAFDGAMDQHCREASRIIKEFSSGWYAKSIYRLGVIDEGHARAFAAVALRKMTAELRRSRGGDG